MVKKEIWLIIVGIIYFQPANAWGFFGHKRINRYAVFLLPPEMLSFYKRHIEYITIHAVDADKRRYIIKDEGPKHYIDLDHYGTYPYTSLPRGWKEAAAKFTIDTLKEHGIAPWHIQFMLQQLTEAFREKNSIRIIKTSADIGHYIADAHVPLHTSSNHNGQKTDQKGIHGFWESRIPELLADKYFDFFIGGANYIHNPTSFIWDRILESAAAADSVLYLEKKLSADCREDSKYAFEERNGKVIRQYSTYYTLKYYNLLNGMVERRMRTSIYSVASLWYTAWVNAGQPILDTVGNAATTENKEEDLPDSYTNKMIGRQED